MSSKAQYYDSDSSSDSDNEVTIKLDKLKKLISIKDNNIILTDELGKFNKPIKIISFLGNARIGKSTLLNCYVSNKMGRNFKIFNTSKSLETHCTSGIDMLKINCSNYDLILLDIQGLDLNDSKDDCKLMLFIYMISNLIIFNPKTILDNTVLSSLQSLTSIITYIPDIESKNSKPSLLFRPRDIDQESDYDPDKNLKDMLSNTSDQFSNVRESIKKLFTTIDCKPTFYLDKKEKTLLTKNKFVDFMEESTNGFKLFCDYLDTMIDNINEHSNDNFNDRVKYIIDQINTNKNIDYTKFDITMREAECDIKEWIFNEIDKSKYDVPMTTDGTQYNYDKVIKPREEYRDLILSKFDKRFEKTTPKIRDEKREEILLTFNKHIDKVFEEAKDIARNKLQSSYDNHIVNKKYETEFIDINILLSDQVKHIYKCWKSIIINDINLNCIKDEYLMKINDYIENVDKQAQEIYNKLHSEFNKYIHIQCKNIIVFINHQKTLLLNTHINDLKYNFDMITEKINNNFKDDVLAKIDYRKYKIKFTKYKTSFDKSEYQVYTLDELNKIIFDHNELNDYKTDKTLKLDDFVKNYLMQFEDEFNKLRKEKLLVILKEMQKDKPKLDSNNYISVKKIYIDNLKLFRELKCEGIKTLTIFNHINNVSHKTTNFEMELIISKYVFIENKLNIHSIYAQEEFDEKYKDILPYLKQMTDDILLNYNITIIIIDILFKKALLI
jgi:hypothetical protein